MNITIYTTPNCVQCNQTKKVFDRADVKYETVDLSTDEESMAKVKSLGYTAAPVVFAGDKHWSGFKLDRIKDVIDKIKMETH
jgi:glutaredoxin-like protein NrdH